jgi:hypothetical protein
VTLEYQRDIPADSDDETIEQTKTHVRDQLAMMADLDDDPLTRREDVTVWLSRHPERADLIRVEGHLEDAEIEAPYLLEGYDPFAGIDPALLAAGMPDRTEVVSTDG